ncbi:MAG: hypothetical protein ABW157_00730 [Candidatus Thiodiazotropha sp. LLP2]
MFPSAAFKKSWYEIVVLTGSSNHRWRACCPEEQSAHGHHHVGRFDLIHEFSIAWIEASGQGELQSSLSLTFMSHYIPEQAKKSVSGISDEANC